MTYRCFVSGCRYKAESALDDFLVCILHDSRKVRAILEQGQIPGAFWWPDGRPIVVPCGELEEKHLEPVEATDWHISVVDDPQMAEVPEGPGMVMPEFDLSRSE